MSASRSRRGAGGFALIAALVILVVLASLGSAALRIQAEQGSGFGLALQARRAYFAAQSGLEWGIHQVAQGGGCPSGSFSLGEGGVDGFDVTVSCSSSAHVEGSSTTTLVQLTASARYGSFGSRDYVSRTLRIVVTR